MSAAEARRSGRRPRSWARPGAAATTVSASASSPGPPTTTIEVSSDRRASSAYPGHRLVPQIEPGASATNPEPSPRARSHASAACPILRRRLQVDESGDRRGPRPRPGGAPPRARSRGRRMRRCIRHGRRAVRESDPLRRPRSKSQRRRSPRAVGQVRPRVAAARGAGGQAQEAGEAAIGAALVVPDHASRPPDATRAARAAAGVATTPTGPWRAGERGEQGVVSTTSPRNAVWMTSVRWPAVTPSLSPPEAPPGRLPAGSRPRRSASCASSPPSASRGACACG